MKKKEMQKLAKKIALAEHNLSAAKDKQDIKKYQNEILELSKQITNPQDVFLLDSLVLNFLEKL